MVRRFPEPAVKNPCQHSLTLSPLETAEVVLGALTVLPLRIIALLAFMPLTWLSMSIPVIGVRPGQHLSPLRRTFVVNVTRNCVRFVLFLCGFLWVRTTGKRVSHWDAPVNVAAPHSTPFDGFLSGGVIYGSTLFCREVLDNFFTRPIMAVTEGIPVDREDRGARSKVAEQVDNFLSSPGRQTHLMAFPEGTCGNGKSLMCFRRGAFLPGKAVQPIALDFHGRPPIAVWTYDTANPVLLFLLHLCRFYTSLTIRYLDVYHPSEAERTDPTLYANNVQAVVASALNMACTQHTRDDGVLSCTAMAQGLPSSVAAIEFGVVKQPLGMNMAELKEQLVRYAQFNTAKDGRITVEEMSSYLCWPVDSHVEALFKEYDTGKYQALSYRDFLFGLVDLARAVPDPSGLQQTAFKALAAGGTIITVAGVQSFFAGGKLAVTVEQSEALIKRWTALSDQTSSAGVTRDTLSSVLHRNPEYLVLLQWTLHGTSSFPGSALSSGDDEPDRRRRYPTRHSAARNRTTIPVMPL